MMPGLRPPARMLDDHELQNLLERRTRFARLVHLATCTSTQDVAAAESIDGPVVVWADHQTQGRGRQAREWHDERGADLAVTFKVRVALPTPLALPAALPIAVLQAIEPLAGRPLRVKWPNDLFLDGKKLCGVLIDAGAGHPDSYLIGIGVNCNRTRFPPDLEGVGTSLALATGRTVDRSEMLLAIAERVHGLLDELVARRHGALEDVLRDRLGLVGQRVRVEAAERHEGVLTGIDFARVELDGRVELPLGSVRGIQRLAG